MKYLSRPYLAVLFCVAVFFCLVCFLVLVLSCGDFVTAYWTGYGAHLQSETIDDGTAKGFTTQNSSQLPTTKVSAQTLAEARPAPPPPPSTKEPKEDAPGTGELSAHAPDHLGAKKPTQPRQEQQPTVELRYAGFRNGCCQQS